MCPPRRGSERARRSPSENPRAARNRSRSCRHRAPSSRRPIPALRRRARRASGIHVDRCHASWEVSSQIVEKDSGLTLPYRLDPAFIPVRRAVAADGAPRHGLVGAPCALAGLTRPRLTGAVAITALLLIGAILSVVLS